MNRREFLNRYATSTAGVVPLGGLAELAGDSHRSVASVGSPPLGSTAATIPTANGQEQEAGSKWQELTHWLCRDVQTDKGFWYSHPLFEIGGLTAEQLFGVPHPNGLCMLWQVGHIAHRERVHIGRFLEGLEGTIIPPKYEVFGTEWCATEEVRRCVGRARDVLAWLRDVRKTGSEYVASLSDDDSHTVPPPSAFDQSAAHWLLITVAHTALHIGRIQLLRALIEGKHERPC